MVQLLNDMNAFYKDGKNASVVLFNKRKRLSDGASTRQVLSREEVVNRAKKQGESQIIQYLVIYNTLSMCAGASGG